MRIIFMITLCGVLFADICKSVTPDLSTAASIYAQNVKTFASVLPATTEASLRPNVMQAEEVLAAVKSMEAKCKNTIDHKSPVAAEVIKTLAKVAENDLILQKDGMFSEEGIKKAKEDAIAASNRLKELLTEIPMPAPAKAPASAKPAAPQSSDSDDDEDDDEEEEDDDDDDSDDEEDDDEEDEDEDDEDE